MTSIHRLILVFREVRNLLNRPDNNFSSSGWDDIAEALAEIDPLCVPLNRGSLERAQTMAFLFLPTGPLQEVSLSSGCGDEFGDLANQFDAAMAATECACFASSYQPDLNFVDQFSTQFHVDVSTAKCPMCGQNWLRLFYEHEAFSRSGRWYLGAIGETKRKDLSPENAVQTVESLEWYWYGGSYFDSVGITSGEMYW